MEKITSHKNLIISADDFGISQLANNNILTLAEAEKLDRVAIMIDGVFSSAEIVRLKKTGVKLDIHLDSTHATSSKHRLKEGVLLRAIMFFSKHLLDHLNSRSKKTQWEKQLEKFHSLFGQHPDGLNSHQHIHFFPAYFKIITSLAQKNNIFFIRFGKIGLIKSNNKIYHILHQLRKIDNKKFISSSLDSSDYMASLDWIKDIPKFLTSLPAGTTEIVCHPERPEEFELIKKYF